MTETALQLQPPGVEFDVLRDIRHREARAARELADWLAWLELGDRVRRLVGGGV